MKRKLIRKYVRLDIQVEPAADDDDSVGWEMAIMSVHVYDGATNEGIVACFDGEADSLHAALVQVLDKANALEREGRLKP